MRARNGESLAVAYAVLAYGTRPVQQGPIHAGAPSMKRSAADSEAAGADDDGDAAAACPHTEPSSPATNARCDGNENEREAREADRDAEDALIGNAAHICGDPQ